MKNNASYRKHRFLTAHRKYPLAFFANSSALQSQKKPVSQTADIRLAASSASQARLTPALSFSSYKLLYFLLLAGVHLTKSQPSGDFLFFGIRDRDYALTCAPDIEATSCYSSAAVLKDWLLDNEVQERCGFQFTNITTEGDRNSILSRKPIFGLDSVFVYAAKNTSRAMTADLQCMESNLQQHNLKIVLITLGFFYACDIVNLFTRRRDSFIIVPTMVLILLPFFCLGNIVQRYVWPGRQGPAALNLGLQGASLSQFTAVESEDEDDSSHHSEEDSPVEDEKDPELTYGSTSFRV